MHERALFPKQTYCGPGLSRLTSVIMSQRIAYQGPTLSVLMEKTKFPNGKVVDLEMIRHPGASAIVPFETKTEVLLIRQFRPAIGGVIWEVPAGKIENESPSACAARELREEVGRQAKTLEALGSVLTTPGFTNEVIHLFAAYELEIVPSAEEEDEFIEVVAMPLTAALDLIWAGELRDAKSAMAILHAARREGLLAP